MIHYVYLLAFYIMFLAMLALLVVSFLTPSTPSNDSNPTRVKTIPSRASYGPTVDLTTVLWTWGVLFVVLYLFDTTITVYAIEQLGATEVNYIMRYAMEHGGTWAFVPVKLGILALIYTMYRLLSPLQKVTVLSIVSGLYAAVAIWNVSVVLG